MAGKISSKAQICNLALCRIEQNSISSFENDDSVQAQFCRMIFEQSKASLLAQYNWTFAIAEAKLQEVEIENLIKEYSHWYALPAEFLRLVGLYNGFGQEIIAITDLKPPYVIEGKFLKTDVTDCCLKFVEDVDEVSRFSSLFVDCLVLDLAIRLTKLFNSSSTYLQELYQEFLMQIEKAKIADCQQTGVAGIRSNPILHSTWGF